MSPFHHLLATAGEKHDWMKNKTAGLQDYN
jgi:hypothetical protein